MHTNNDEAERIQRGIDRGFAETETRARNDQAYLAAVEKHLGRPLTRDERAYVESPVRLVPALPEIDAAEAAASPARDTYELRAPGAAAPWAMNFESVGAAYSALDGYAPRDLGLRVLCTRDGVEMARVSYL